ncbi:hypothetical protein ABZS81_17210, partial [Streptomyces sp. NPDC005318]
MEHRPRRTAAAPLRTVRIPPAPASAPVVPGGAPELYAELGGDPAGPDRRDQVGVVGHRERKSVG